MTNNIYEVRNSYPCKQSCDKRSTGCHGTCKEYLEWKEKLDTANKEFRDKRDVQNYDAHAKLHSMRYNKKDYIWKK